jgi:iron(III) transport system ATP-binding protein
MPVLRGDWTSEQAISTRGLTLRYGKSPVLNGIDLTLPAGKTLALLGPSGCGKTTLLRLVAGLLAPTLGEIAINGAVVAGPDVFVPPEKRHLGMVFQDYALWPHLTVAGNVAFPLEMAGIGRAAREMRVMAALDRVGLAAMATRSPSALSGGQQQRVAIARAIVGEPRIVLFDEPLSNLDRELRETMVAELGALIRGLGLTAVYVTHDQSEALSLADQVAVMVAGEIAQLAAPEELVEQPSSAKVAEFLRLGAVLPLTRTSQGWSYGDRFLGPLGGPDLAAANALIPPRALRVTSADAGTLSGAVLSVQLRDTGYAVTLRLDDHGRKEGPHNCVQIFSPTRLRVGERVGLQLVPEYLRWFPPQTEKP